MRTVGLESVLTTVAVRCEFATRNFDLPSIARTASASCAVTFSKETETYELSKVASFDGAPGNYVVDLTDKPYEAKLVSADFGGSGQILFDGWGTPSSGGSVVVAVGVEERTIVVDGETGQVTIQ